MASAVDEADRIEVWRPIFRHLIVGRPPQYVRNRKAGGCGSDDRSRINDCLYRSFAPCAPAGAETLVFFFCRYDSDRSFAAECDRYFGYLAAPSLCALPGQDWEGPRLEPQYLIAAPMPSSALKNKKLTDYNHILY